eukprot:8568464-Pyramimonas_sp.AAC.1
MFSWAMSPNTRAPAVGAAETRVVAQLNEATAELENISPKGQWELNSSKTNHLSCLRGTGGYSCTRR